MSGTTKHPLSLEKITLVSRKALRVLEAVLDEYSDPDEDTKRPQASVAVGAAKTVLDIANKAMEIQTQNDPDAFLKAEALKTMTTKELEQLLAKQEEAQ